MSGVKSFEDLMNMSDEELMSQVSFPSGSSEEPVQEEDDRVENQNDDSQNQEVNEENESNPDVEEESEDAEANSDDAGEDEGEEGDEDNDEGDSKGGEEVEDTHDDGKPSDGDQSDTKPGDGDDATSPDKKGKKPTLTNKNKKESKVDNKDGDKNVPSTKETKDNQVDEPDYKALYEQIMKPFKANGREVKLDTPDEVIKLMQMGANYTKKMQALQPNLKVLKMLENNQLLDENKLSYLIDISKGDKNAITKLIKDAGIDPMDMDTNTDIEYKPSNHRVSDNEVQFTQYVEDISTSDHGRELIIQMHHHWDEASKQAVYDAPDAILMLAQHKESGIYDQIADVIEKEKLKQNSQIARLPFIEAYKSVGTYLQKNGLLRGTQQGTGNTSHPSQESTQTRQPLAKAPAPRKKTVANSEKAKAASPSAKSSKKVVQNFNPLAMSDEEFLKQMENRV